MFGIVIRGFFIEMNWLPFIAVMLSVYQFMLLFNSIGHIIPTRYLLGSFMCIQFFIGPTLAYNGLDQYQYFMYRMRVPETDYFLYVIPAVIAFVVGLHMNAGKFKGEIVDQERIALFVQKNNYIPYTFIVMGFFASVISGFFGSELAFVFYLLGSFKFIGLFLLILGGKNLKVLPLLIVMGSIVSSSLLNGMFHDLLTWTIFTASVFGIRYRFDFRIKLIGLAAFVFIAVSIQVLKSSYREATGIGGSQQAGVQTFAKLYEEKNDEGGGVFAFQSLAISNVRINQGFIITNIMATVPSKVPYANGEEMYMILEAALLPRLIAPDKLKAGDRSIFVKYSGIPIQAGTSMGLSSLGDAYVNFGILGGIGFMLLLGLFYSEVLNMFHKQSRYYPILILFTALVFYYPIRPDCELQTILGHLVKSCFLLFIMIWIWKHIFWMRPSVK